MSPDQRLAWAKKRGVTPPAELVELARVEAPKVPRRSCCAGHGEELCGNDAGSRKSCCGGKAAKGTKAAAKKEAKGAEGGRGDSEPRFARFARSRCRGFGGSWVTLRQPLGLPEKPAGVTAGDVREPVVIATADYIFFLSPPPTRPG